MRYRHNMHIHTFRSGCAKPEMVIADIVDRAQAAGLEVIGLTDHVNIGSDEEIAALREDREEVERVRPVLKVLVGAEVTMLSPERLAMTPQQAEGLDFVMIATNHYHLTDIVEQPPNDSPQATAEHSLRMMEGAIETGLADIIAHPLAPIKVGSLDSQEILHHLTPERLAPVLHKAAERGTAMELNPVFVKRFREFYAVFIQACIEHGVRFALGSDAHSLDAIPYAVDGVYRGVAPQDLAALGVRESGLMDPLASLRRH